MKKYLIILLLCGWTVLSYAAGPPVQPVTSLKGCWYGEYIMTQTGGSSEGVHATKPPFYSLTGAKRLGWQYLWIENQSGMKFTGNIVNAKKVNDTTFTWLRYPLEGYINGNLVSYYSYVEQNNIISGLEEQRTFNGLLNSNGEIWGSGISARNLNPNSIPNWGTNPAVYEYRWSVVPLTIKFTKTSNETCSNPPPPTPDLSAWVQCLPAINVCPGIPAAYVEACVENYFCPWAP